MTNYAFNLGDLLTFKTSYSIMYDSMLYPILDMENIIVCEKSVDAAVGVKETILEERVKAVIDVLRSGVGRLPAQHKNTLRIYSKTRDGWKRI